MNSQRHETSEERGHSMMSILTSLHKPVQLYARLNMHSCRTGLIVFTLTFILLTVSTILCFFMMFSPLDTMQIWLPALSSVMRGSIPMFLGIITFFFASSAILALILRHVTHEQVKFSVPFTIASISFAMYWLIRGCLSWILTLLLVFDPFNILQTSEYVSIIDTIIFVSCISAVVVFFWYMTRGILAVTKLQVRYAVLIAVVTFVIAGIVSVIEIPVYFFLLNG